MEDIQRLQARRVQGGWKLSPVEAYAPKGYRPHWVIAGGLSFLLGVFTYGTNRNIAT